MNWFTKAFTSSLGRKWIMALSGLFMCLFLVVHVSGNFQLFKDDGGYAFNTYTIFMVHNPVIKTISYLLYLTIIIHMVQSLLLTLQNRTARPQNYVYNRPEKNSTWSSRNMGILGTILLVFLVIHFADFWAEYKFGEVKKNDYVVLDFGDHKDIYTKEQTKSFTPEFIQNIQMQNPKVEWNNNVKDLYLEVKLAFQQPWYVLFYLLSLLALSYHLIHGFQSAWQSMGVNHRKYVPIIKTVGWFFSIVIPAGFAAMPVYFLMDYINNGGVLDWARFF